MIKTLGPYRIVRPLAVGGQAEILLAELEGPGGFVIQHALKMLKVPLNGSNPLDVTEARSLIAEARLLAQLSHPNTLAIHGLHVFDDRLVMVMEYVAGRSLATLLSRLSDSKETLPVEHALWVSRCALMAMDRAHSLRDKGGRPLSVVHRDINPQNIILGFEGQIKLIDYGIAISKLASRDTRFGVVKGKLAYMSPEQAYGVDDIDHRADIYALGLVLYEMVTGKQALEGDEEGALERARDPSIPQARRLKSRLPATIDAILARALARKPDRRFQTAREMMVACSELLHSFNPRFCGDEMGPFIRAVLRQELLAEKKQRKSRGTQVVFEDDVSAQSAVEEEIVPDEELDFDPQTLRFDGEVKSLGPPPKPKKENLRRHNQSLRRLRALKVKNAPSNESAPSMADRSALRYQPHLAVGRSEDKSHPLSEVDDALDLGELLRAIEDIYKRRSGEDTDSKQASEESTIVFKRDSVTE